MGTNPLPFLRGTSGGLNGQALYPFTRTVGFLTNVTTFANGSEQRQALRPGPLYDFSLPMGKLNATDKASWLAFNSTVRGRFNQNLTATLGATTYGNLTMMSDDLSQTNQTAALYDQQVSLRQVKDYPFSLPSVLTVFPLLSFESPCERPFTQTSGYLTSINESQAGQRFAYEWYGASLTGFPGTGSGAAVSITVTGGAVTAATVTAGGSNYVMATIPVTGTGKGAAVAPVFTGGVLTGATVVRGGHGYTSATGTVTPSTYLRSWKLEYPLLSDADAATLETAFTGWQGKYASFTFVDPLDGIAYTNVRCDQDELALRGNTVNQQSTSLTLRQTNGS